VAENLICPGQRIQTNAFRANYDRIFSKATEARASFLDNELMEKDGVKKWVELEDVWPNVKKGWRRVE
jgi:hypothetical protein